MQKIEYFRSDKFRHLLRLKLKERGVSMRMVALNCGCSTSTVKRFLDGDTEISYNLLFNILQYLGITNIELKIDRLS